MEGSKDKWPVGRAFQYVITRKGSHDFDEIQIFKKRILLTLQATSNDTFTFLVYLFISLLKT